MRLINTETYELCDFPQNQIPQYAILSHTWTKHEVTYSAYIAAWPFQDVERFKQSHVDQGWQKIFGLCKEARAHGHLYAWIDTCCIDKSSSAELSEAINSMFRWYSKADICYVYLEDFATDYLEPAQLGQVDITYCRWFTRGWTLQELLAPCVVDFFSASWDLLGNKTSLADSLSRVTMIPHEILEGSKSLFSVSIAQRMSWASHRQTTREEDIAYCLMGLFDINMPMLYGEGRKAFFRLQEEISKVSSDQTLFAWEYFPDDPYTTGLLARHPRNFWASADFEDKSQLKLFSHSDHNVSGRGVSISAFLFANPDDSQQDKVGQRRFQMYLKCTKGDDSDKFAVLSLEGLNKDSSEFVRIHDREEIFVSGLGLSRLKGYETRLFVPHNTAQTNETDFRLRKFASIGILTNYRVDNIYITDKAGRQKQVTLSAYRYHDDWMPRDARTWERFYRYTKLFSNRDYWSEHQYPLPWMPRSRIFDIRLRFLAFDKDVHLHLGVDEMAQTGHIAYITENHRSLSAQPETQLTITSEHNYTKSMTNLKLAEIDGYDTMCTLVVDAPDIEQVRADHPGKIMVMIMIDIVPPMLSQLWSPWLPWLMWSMSPQNQELTDSRYELEGSYPRSELECSYPKSELKCLYSNLPPNI